MGHVFLSYKHDDIDIAENIKSRLERVGFEVWMDEHIRAGDEWRDQIDQAIKSAFAMIVIMTPEAKASEYVTYEWSCAVGIGIRIIPIKYKQTPLHPRLEAFQYLDFTNSHLRPWDRLIAEVKEAEKTPVISATAESRPQSFVEQIKMELNSSDTHTRGAAIDTLAQTNNSEAQDTLLEALEHPIADVRERAARTLGRMHYQAAVPICIDLLRDPEHDVRIASITALENMRVLSTLPDLLAMLPGANIGEKIHIVRACSTFGDISVVPTLLTLYEETESKTLGRTIIDALAKLRSEAAIPILREALYDPTLEEALRDPEYSAIGVNAVQALLRIGSQEAIGAMADELLSMSKAQCETVIGVLSLAIWERNLSSTQIDKLVAYLDERYRAHTTPHIAISDREKYARVRRRIVWIFGLLKNKNSVPVLITAMDDEDPVVQQETIVAFKSIQDERILPALMTILGWRFEYYDAKTLLYAIQALRQVGNSNILPQLKMILNDMLEKDIELAVQLISIFGKFGNYEMVEYLRNLKSSIQENGTYQIEKKKELVDTIEQALKEIRARL